MYLDREEMPRVFGTQQIIAAVVVHILLFASLWYLGVRFDDSSDEEVIPIECLVVVHENLDGVEDEPPPETEVQSEQEPESAPEPEPEPEPVVEPPPPPPPDQVVVVPDKVETPKEEQKTVEPPKEEPKKVEPPKPTPEELKRQREERLKKMRESMVRNPTPRPRPPRNNGRTAERPPDWEKLLNAGYKPAAVNAGLDASEEQRCYNLIYRAFHDKWDPPPWNDQLRKMDLRIHFGPGGTVRRYELVSRSGDPAADNTVLRAAQLVPAVRGLTSAYIEKNPTVTIRFEVTPQ